MRAVVLRLSGVLAAICVAIPWLIDHSLVSELQQETAAMDRILTEQEQVRSVADLSRDQRTLIKAVARVELSLDGAKASEQESAEADLKWIEAVKADFLALGRTADKLRELAAGVAMSPETQAAVSKAVDEAAALSKQFVDESAGFERAARAEAGDDDADGVNAAALMDQHWEQLDGSIERLEAVETALVEQYEAVLKAARVDRENTASLASAASAFAWIMTVIGSGLALAGRWLGSAPAASESARAMAQGA